MLNLVERDFTKYGRVLSHQSVQLTLDIGIHNNWPYRLEQRHPKVLILIVTDWNSVDEDFMANVLNTGLIAGCFGAWNFDELVLPINRYVVPSTVESDWLACVLALHVGSSREYCLRV